MYVTAREFLNGIVKIRVKSEKNIGHFTANTYTFLHASGKYMGRNLLNVYGREKRFLEKLWAIKHVLCSVVL